MYCVNLFDISKPPNFGEWGVWHISAPTQQA
jgi:hypothetical protein